MLRNRQGLSGLLGKVPGQNPGDYTVDHTGIVYLMDKRGKFVSTFNLQRPPQEAARELEAYLKGSGSAKRDHRSCSLFIDGKLFELANLRRITNIS
jgi:hypothetical protein